MASGVPARLQDRSSRRRTGERDLNVVYFRVYLIYFAVASGSYSSSIDGRTGGPLQVPCWFRSSGSISLRRGLRLQ
jgi:hypothetical protein